MNRTLKIALAAVVVLGIAAFAFDAANLFRAPLDKSMARIAITKVDGRCRATTSDQAMQGRRWNAVTWTIDDPDKCLAEADVEIRFEGDNSPFWVSRPQHKMEIKRHVKPWAGYGTYPYKVWAVFANSASDYAMEDPKLEIVE